MFFLIVIPHTGLTYQSINQSINQYFITPPNETTIDANFNSSYLKQFQHLTQFLGAHYVLALVTGFNRHTHFDI